MEELARLEAERGTPGYASEGICRYGFSTETYFFKTGVSFGTKYGIKPLKEQ